MPSTSFLDRFDEEHPEYESLLEFAQAAVQTPFVDAADTYSALSDLHSGLADLENLEEAPSVNAVRDLLKSASAIEDGVNSMVWSTFEKCLDMAAQCYPAVEPPFEDWMEESGYRSHSNGIPYGGRAFVTVLYKFPLNTLMPVLSLYFDPKKFPKHRLEEHVEALLGVAAGQVRNSQIVKGDADAKAAAWMYVLTERVFAAHSETQVTASTKLPALFFAHHACQAQFLPFIFQKWSVFSEAQVQAIKQSMAHPSRWGDGHKARLNETAELPWNEWQQSFGTSVLQVKQVLNELATEKLSAEEQAVFQRKFLRHTLLEDSSHKQPSLAL